MKKEAKEKLEKEALAKDEQEDIVENLDQTTEQ